MQCIISIMYLLLFSGFAKKSNLKLHIKSVHEGNKSFKCGICNTVFSYDKYLNGRMAALLNFVYFVSVTPAEGLEI